MLQDVQKQFFGRLFGLIITDNQYLKRFELIERTVETRPAIGA